MIRVDRSELTKNEIVRLAANRFLKDGYTKTSIHAMCKTLNMSTGNMTFHFPTKEHLLAELVDMLCNFQWKLMEWESKEGNSSIMAICLELISMASACEQDEVARDFFISTYTSPMCLEIIRRNDTKRAKEVFSKYCPEWTDDQFAEAETLVSGIEYATLMTTGDSAPLELRLEGALDTILSIYNVPKDMREAKIKKVLTMDYKRLGRQTLENFRTHVDKTTEQALLDLLKKRTV